MKGHLYFVLRKNGEITQYPGAWLFFVLKNKNKFHLILHMKIENWIQN